MPPPRDFKSWRIVRVPGAREISGIRWNQPLFLSELVCARFRLWAAGAIEGEDFAVEHRRFGSWAWYMLLPEPGWTPSKRLTHA